MPEITNAQFEKAAEDAKALKSRPTDADLLTLYALYKQGTVGDVNTERPGFMDFKGKAKWDQWSALKGMGKGEAQEKYVAHVERLKQQHN